MFKKLQKNYSNFILKCVTDTQILIYVNSQGLYYFQNKHNHIPLIMLHMTTRILTINFQVCVQIFTKYTNQSSPYLLTLLLNISATLCTIFC